MPRPRAVPAAPSKGSQTRSAILEQALGLASRLGLEGVSIGVLADEVGISKSGLYAHFESKQDLQVSVLGAAIERFVQTVVAPALRERRGEPRVRALFERWLEWERAAFQPGGCVFIAAAHEFDDRPGPVRDRLVGCQRDFLQALATAARVAIDEGHFRRDLDADQFAYDFYAIILGYHHLSRLLRDPEAELRVRRSFEQLVAASRADG